MVRKKNPMGQFLCNVCWNGPRMRSLAQAENCLNTGKATYDFFSWALLMLHLLQQRFCPILQIDLHKRKLQFDDIYPYL